MHYVLEAVAVGAYSCVVMLLLLPFFPFNFCALFFATGFAKHWLGHFLGLHTLYCNHGAACESRTFHVARYTSSLLWESILEGGLFSCIGMSLICLCPGGDACLLVITFATGFALHAFFEKARIHASFCKQRCVSVSSSE
jgi:hypothetical protein